MLRNEIYVGMRIWNRTQFVKVPGTNKRIARWRPHDQLQKQPAPELRVVSDALWVKVQERQGLLKEKYADSGRKPVNRGGRFSLPSVRLPHLRDLRSEPYYYIGRQGAFEAIWLPATLEPPCLREQIHNQAGGLGSRFLFEASR
jgi:hypothetical protein